MNIDLPKPVNASLTVHAQPKPTPTIYANEEMISLHVKWKLAQKCQHDVKIR